jgi:hypothetical protein
MNDRFSINRFVRLLRHDALASYRSVLIVSAAQAIIIVLVALLTGPRHRGSVFYEIWFIGMLFAWGTISASLSFAELHDKHRNSAFLLLPASALEKTLVPLLSGTILFVAYLLVYTTAVSLVAEGVKLAMIGERDDVFDAFDPLAWQLIPHFFVAQSVFFLGAAWFRKAHHIKTALAIAMLAAGLVGLVWLIGWALSLPPASGVRVYEGDFYARVQGPLETLFDTVLKPTYFVGLPVFCWFVAWLRVKETQVSHGV